MTDLLAAPIYAVVLGLLAPFGLHRLRLLWLRLRRPPVEAPVEWTGALPRVTVQLPVYNEANVVERLIDAACSLDYPRHLLEVQLLDDSDDETTAIASARIRRWRTRGVRVHHVRRGTRRGFKAGALAHGTALSAGDFLIVLDADFVPPPDLVRRLLPPFLDPRVGAVQAAWAHLDANRSWLTRAQALFLDAHFAIEHEARYRTGLFFNFNGSAGMWRRSCVDAAGGWSSDTLTEDVDLSYRAQLAGWRFAYLDDVRVPAELPATLRAIEIQQSRWTQGGVQSARKLLPRIWRASLPTTVKLEATAHLVGHIVHPLTLALGVSLALAGWVGLSGPAAPAWLHGLAIAMATVPFVLFYGAAGLLRGVPGRRLPRRTLEAMLLGLGLGVPLAAAVARGLVARRTPFARTPKRGAAPRVAYPARLDGGASLARAGLALALAAAAGRLLLAGSVGAVPFTGLFALAYLATLGEDLRALAPRAVQSQ